MACIRASALCLLVLAASSPAAAGASSFSTCAVTPGATDNATGSLRACWQTCLHVCRSAASTATTECHVTLPAGTAAITLGAFPTLDVPGCTLALAGTPGAGASVIDGGGNARPKQRLLSVASPAAEDLRRGGQVLAAKPPHLRLADLTIRGFTGSKYVVGGAVTLSGNNPTATIAGVAFESNGGDGMVVANQTKAGAALVLLNATVTIAGSTFVDNAVAQNGGAIWCKACELEIDSSSFTRNRAHKGTRGGGIGGAIYNEMGSVTVTRSAFRNNSCPYHVGMGGAISTYRGDLTLNVCTFDGNTAKYGGAVHHGGGVGTGTLGVAGGGAFLRNAARSNVAGGAGGALWVEGARVFVTGATRFANNTAAMLGGAIFASGAPVAVGAGAAFDGNAAGEHGGALHYAGAAQRGGWPGGLTLDGATFERNAARGGLGGAVSSWGDVPTGNVTRCAFDANSAGGGGGAFAQVASGSAATNASAVVLERNTFAATNVAPVGADVLFDDGGLGFAAACRARLHCNGEGLRVAPAAPTPGITVVPCR